MATDGLRAPIRKATADEIVFVLEQLSHRNSIAIPEEAGLSVEDWHALRDDVSGTEGYGGTKNNTMMITFGSKFLGAVPIVFIADDDVPKGQVWIAFRTPRVH
ncbi:MAG: hypothetical protein ACR2P5_06020 [Gammaproteobacteria bacterium]